MRLWRIIAMMIAHELPCFCSALLFTKCALHQCCVMRI